MATGTAWRIRYTIDHEPVPNDGEINCSALLPTLSINKTPIQTATLNNINPTGTLFHKIIKLPKQSELSTNANQGLK